MKHAPNSPAGTRSDATATFPPRDSGQAPDALTEAHSAFDPAEWLAAFAASGGGWIVRDCLSLVFRIEDQPDDAMVAARLMVASLTPAKRKAIIAHLREREAL
jgi:hypothetical protein